MCDGHRGPNVVVPQQHIPIQQVVEIVEGVSDVVRVSGSGTLSLQRHWRSQQRYAVVLVVEGDEAQRLILIHDVPVEHRAIPIAHLLRLTGLENHMRELGLSQHRLVNLLIRIPMVLWRLRRVDGRQPGMLARSRS